MSALLAGRWSKERVLVFLHRLRQPVQIESTDVSYWPISLRFVDPLIESAFIQTRTAQVKGGLAVCCWYVGFASGFWSIAIAFNWSTSGAAFIKCPETSQAALARNIIILCLFPVLAAGINGPKLSKLGPMGVELLVIIICCCPALIIEMQNPSYVLIMNGADPTKYMGGFGDNKEKSVLWLVSILVQISHTMIPVRWIMLLILELVVATAYPVIAFGLGSAPALEIGGNAIGLLCFVSLVACGTRSVEANARTTFSIVATERTKRAAAEYQLADTLGKSVGLECEDREDVVSIAKSGAPSNVSCDVFENLRKNAASSLPSFVKQVVHLGLKEHWLIASSNLRPQPNKVLGHGGFGLVLVATYHGAEVVLKVCRGLASSGPESLSSMISELRVFRRLRHPNIVGLLGACIEHSSGDISLVLEFIRGPTLCVYCQEASRAGPSDVRRCQLLSDVSCALLYMHSLNPIVVHGDIKGANVLVLESKDSVQAKLTDFGLSRVLGGGRVGTLGGTLAWMAPEIVSGSSEARRPAPSADVFSFGRLIYMVITGRKPLEAMDRKAIESALRLGEVPNLAWPAGLPLGHFAQFLVSQCCRGDTQKRPSMQVVRKNLLAWPLPTLFNSQDCTSIAITVGDALSTGHDSESDADFAIAPDEARKKLSKRNASATVRCPSVKKGTPCTSSWSTFNTELFKPQFLETPEETRRLTLAMTLCSWNLRFDRVSQCCSSHTLLDEAVRLLTLLRTARCTCWNVYDGLQCPKCKVLDIELDGDGRTVRVCGVCDHSSNSQPTSAASAVDPAPAAKPDAQLHEPPQSSRFTVRDSARTNSEVMVQL